MSVFGKKIIKFDTTTSTFDELKKLPAENGVAVVAKRQTDGHGRCERPWVSDAGGLYFSFYIVPGKQTDVPFTSIQCALAAYKTVSEYVDCAIKWPNDIVCDGKKVCGILIKSFVENNKITLMAGVGINVSNTHFAPELSDRAVSIKEISGKDFDGDEILEKFFSHFEDVHLYSTKTEIINQYRKACITIGSDVCVQYLSGGEQINGVCTDVCDDGTLAVVTSDGTVRVNSGEVSVRGVYGYV